MMNTTHLHAKATPRGGRAIWSLDLWATCILHAALIAGLVLWNKWMGGHLLNVLIREPGGYDFRFNPEFAMSVGMALWFAEVVAYWGIRSRFGQAKAILFGAIMTGIWTLLLLASLAWAVPLAARDHRFLYLFY